MARKVGLTTIDNPYNPFDDFTSWLMFDIEKGYNTSDYTLIEEWTVPTYQQDKQFWVENGTIEHKTEVLYPYLRQCLRNMSEEIHKQLLCYTATSSNQKRLFGLRREISRFFFLCQNTTH